ncbi:MAG: hypothetical protein KIS78_04705 [Labilithrix sp.]|nr:hypothetical protein [Labilithrix sp.]
MTGGGLRAASLVLAACAFTACSGSDGAADDESGPPESSPTERDGGDPTSTDGGVVGAPDVRVRFGGEELAAGTTRAIELGSTREGGFTPSVDVVVENPGTGPVSLSASNAGAFSATLPATLAPGATAKLTLAMPPTAVGAHEATIELKTSVPGKESFRFDLRGFVLVSTGVPLNPYWTTAPWKLWFEDPTPVTFTGPDEDGNTHTLEVAPPPAESRRFPSPAALAATWPGVFLGLETAPPSPAAAGWWDDVSGTMDRGHSKPWQAWSGQGGNNVNLTGQFMRLTFGSPGGPQRMAVGMNFASESYAYRGHQLTRSTGNVVDIERNSLFANTLRGSPSFYSYSEVDADHTTDNYDGLYGIAYQSLGRSSSETRALQKMFIAGGFMPRPTKELLKRHGLYATVMLTLFRQALPYVNADGSPVDYEGEMIQRSTYLSDGNAISEEFAPNNITFHQYNDTMHLFRMVQGAKALTTAPPVAVMKLLDVWSSTANGAPTKWAATDPRLKVRGKTITTIWADPEETLDVRIDLGESIDLEGGELDFSAKAVYPNQQSALVIEREGKTAIFHVRATPDPKLPLGRVPIILQAHVRGLRSNPTFLNVFWRQPDQQTLPANAYFDATRTGSYGMTNNKQMAVFWNARPTLTTSLGAATTIAGTQGTPVTFTVSCVDPEGFSTRLYRRADDPGTLTNGTYSFTPTASGSRDVALICSDGTGAFASTKITIEVP